MIVLSMLLTGFGGLAFAGVLPDGGMAATATSKTISDFDFAAHAASFTVSDGAHPADISLAANVTDMNGLVGAINQALSGVQSNLTAAAAGGSFTLTSSVIGKSSYIAISGADAAAFFANTEYRGTATDAESVADTKIGLTPFFGEDESMGRVLTSMTLPNFDYFNGTSISWSSDTPSIIDNQGHVAQPRPLHDTTVTLTAAITKGDASDTQAFALNVVGTAPPVMTDEEAVANTRAGLTPFFATDETSAYVLHNFKLPTKDAINGTTISWTWISEPASVLTDGGSIGGDLQLGTVSRQSATVQVVLTATITRGPVTDTAEFPISVIGMDAERILLAKSGLSPVYASGDSAVSVTQDLLLPTTLNGTIGVSWSSSNEQALAVTGTTVKTGTVHQPSFSAGPAQVELTATLTLGDAVDTLVIPITVATLPETNAEAVDYDAAHLPIGYQTGDTEAGVTGDVTLSTTGSHGSTIAWTSDKPEMVSDSGVVSRPSFTAGPAQVTLTATITKGSVTDTQTATITIAALPETNAEAVDYDSAHLAVGYQAGDTEASVTGDLALDTVGSHGSTITWASDKPAVVSNDGTVNRPSFTAGPAQVTLTATIAKGGDQDTQTFSVAVPALSETDAEAVDYDAAHLTVGYQAGDTKASVTGNVTLNTAGPHGSTIAWTSDQSSVVSNDGVVRRSEGRSDAVTLTAVVTKGAASRTVSFPIAVIGVSPVVPVTPPTKPATPANEWTSATDALIGAGHEALAAPVQTSVGEAGETVTKINEAELLDQLSGSDASTVVVPLGETNGKSIVSLTPGLLTALLQKDANAAVVLQRSGVTYELPAALADIGALEKTLGLSGDAAKNAEIRVTIDLVPASDVQEQLDAVHGTPAAAAASFSITVVTPDRTYELNDFQGIYIQRSFILQPSVDTGSVVGVVLQSDGSVTPVPTQITNVDGTPVAVLGADHNSVYTVISHTSKLSDIGASWAKDKIAALADKLVINGYEDGSFKPNANVTRAEFAQMITKGLGLNTGAGAPKFTDVSASAWYAGVLDAMVSRGFITGYEDGSFKPNQSITRQEEAVILGRVLGYLHQAADANASTLERFHDRGAVAGYAKSAVAALVGLDIMNGDAKGDLNPAAAATRAETAALLYNLLRLTGLLQ